MYTTQGAYDYFLGKEGESYIINDEGHTELTDLVTVDHNGSMSNFTLFPGGANPGLLTDDTFKGGETYWTSLEGNAKFDPYLPEVIWEKFPLTTEESDIINNAKGDIDAVFKEYTAYFITGQLDIDADWQAYLDKLNAAGLENYMKAYQEAYDNLNA